MDKYIITNGINYVDDKYSFTNDREKAIKFKKEFSAYNVLNKNLHNPNCDYYIEKIAEIDFYKKKHGKYMIDYIENVANQELMIYDKNNLLDSNVDEILELISILPTKLNNEKIKINSYLIKCSRILTDTMHYKEFNVKRSASERCKLDVFEQKIILKRRELKDKILKIDEIENRLNGGFKKIQLENREYKPRELNNMFETNTIPNFDELWKEQ